MRSSSLGCAEPKLDVFSQVKVLFKNKGMTLEDAIKEVEDSLYCRLPDDLKIRIKEESYRW